MQKSTDAFNMHEGFPVLLVEDTADDAWLVKRAFASAGLKHPLFIAEDGRQAIDYFCGRGQYADRKAFPLPHLVIADLKMPRVNGFELIKWMRDDDYARFIPIIVMSSSALHDDVNRAYELGANAYMVKPADYRALERLITTIAQFWDASQKPPIDSSRRSVASC